jgi:hypothetical protein
MTQHKDYKFSVKIHSDDLALISSMRGLAWHCQFDGNKQISWGNIKERDWASAGHKATFHFSRQNYRDNFIREAKNLFHENMWRIEDQSNNDPAEPAR